jgi:peroxiredoxin
MWAVLLALTAAKVQVGDTIPSITLDLGFPPAKIDIAERIADKKVVLVGLPGAFTPT